MRSVRIYLYWIRFVVMDNRMRPVRVYFNGCRLAFVDHRMGAIRIHLYMGRCYGMRPVRIDLDQGVAVRLMDHGMGAIRIYLDGLGMQYSSNKKCQKGDCVFHSVLYHSKVKQFRVLDLCYNCIKEACCSYTLSAYKTKMHPLNNSTGTTLALFPDQSYSLFQQIVLAA